MRTNYGEIYFSQYLNIKNWLKFEEGATFLSCFLLNRSNLFIPC